MPLLLPFDGVAPVVHPTAWVAPNATLVGAVTISEGASVWFGAVIRADGAPIGIGRGSNVQDGCVLHTDVGVPLALGVEVSVGHHAVLHGCTIEDGVLIGMNATVLNGSVVGCGSLIAAGGVILDGTRVPARSLAAGVPAKVRRGTTDEEVAMILDNANGYRARAAAYRTT